MSTAAASGQPPPVPRAILVVYAHPDDESFGPSAILAKYARAGSSIYGLFATRGEHGESTMDPAPTPAELGRLREADLREAAQIIGFRAIEVLDYEDGTLAEVPATALEERIFSTIRRCRPEVLLTFGPAGITRHPDHLAIHRAAVSAFHRALGEGYPLRELYYDAVPSPLAAERGLEGEPDGQPNTFIDVAATLPIKVAALKMHARHIADARQMVASLEQRQAASATLHRAWPAVADGATVHGFLEP